MRFEHGILVALCLVAGCQSKAPKDSPDQPARPAAGSAAKGTKGGGLGPGNVSAPASNITSSATVVLPASGRVHSVNTGLRFVVIDYTLGGMPAMGSLLFVYRNNERVGQIKLSGPEPRNGFVTGDVVEGFIQPDDEVRVH